MGYNQVPLFVLVALALFAASSPMAHALLLGMNALNISGILNFPCAGMAALSGVPVNVNCTNILGVSVTVGTATTDVNGAFNIKVSNVESLLGNNLSFIPVCTAIVKLPININGLVCPTLTTVKGILTSTTLTATNLLSGLLGPVGGILDLFLSGYSVIF